MSDIVYKKFRFSTPFLGGFRALKIPILDADGNSVWPELFSNERIQFMRQSVEIRHFSAQMMLEFVPPERIRLDPGGLKIYESAFDVRTARIATHLISGAAGILDTLRDSWFLIAFVAGAIYWVARQDSSLAELIRADHRITALENRTTVLETGIGQIQIKIDGIQEDIRLIKSAVIK